MAECKLGPEADGGLCDDGLADRVARAEEEEAVLGKSGGSSGLSRSGRKMPRWLALDELAKDRTRVTENRDRVKTITQKLSKLQQGLEGDKNRERATFDKRLKELESRIEAASGEQDSRLEEADTQIEHLMEALGQERLARELLDERKSKEGELLSKSVDLALQAAKQELAAEGAEQAAAVRRLEEALAEEQGLRKAQEARFGDKMLEQVAALTEEMAKVREQNAQLAADNGELRNLVAKLAQDATARDEAIAAEGRARTELEGTVVDWLENLCEKMRGEISSERQDREAMEETVLKLIEETASRVEGGLLSESR